MKQESIANVVAWLSGKTLVSMMQLLNVGLV